MSDGFDFTELTELAADLGDAPKEAIPNVRKALEVTARKVKDDWRKGAKGSSGKHAKRYPSTIAYDMKLNTDAEMSAEIGPSLGGQGSLGILEEARGGVRSRPQQAGRDAMNANLEDFVTGLEKAIGEPL